MKKRILSILLSICLCLTLLPTVAFAVDWSGWTALAVGTNGKISTEIMAGGKYYLNQDLTISGTLTISVGKATSESGADQPVTLDLNGHVLALAPAEGSAGSGRVIQITETGSLTLQDSDSTALHLFTPDKTGRWVLDETNGTKSVRGGVITGGTSGSDISNGGGVHNQGTFIMNGGVIAGNSSYNGGGVKNEGAFTMTGGQIIGNAAIRSESTGGYGGGVYSHASQDTPASFTMRGGAISGNSVSCADGSGLGGGLFYSNDCTVIMIGGTITGNNADGKGGGVYCGSDDFTVSEGASVTDNVVGGTEGTDYQYYGGKDSNVYLRGSMTITISGSFYGTLGVTTEQTAAYPSAVTIAVGAQSTNNAYYFTSDNGLYSVEKTYDKEAYVIQFVGKCAHENLTETAGTYTCNNCGKSMVAKLTRGEGERQTRAAYFYLVPALFKGVGDKFVVGGGIPPTHIDLKAHRSSRGLLQWP